MRYILFALAFVACRAPALTAQSPMISVSSNAGPVMVKFEQQNGEVLHFAVINSSDKTVVVNRDAVMLRTAKGVQAREKGGLKSVYMLKPGAVHGVKCRFDLGDVTSGEQVEVLFNDALLIDGKPLEVQPVAFIAG